VTKFDASILSARIAGEVNDFSPEAWGMDRRESRRMDVFTQYAVAASEMAMRESGLPIGTEKPHGYEAEKVAVIIGSGIGGIGSLEEQHRRALEKGFDRISPFFILQMIINMAPGLVSIRYGAKGPNWSPVSACSTSAHAIGEAVKSIRIGETDAAIAGGAEASITPLSIGGFAVMKALSTRNDDPSTASRPFDLDRDGFVMGEGAGVVVLEELEHAKRRGANILSEVVGYGANSDAFHETQPAPGGEGAARCMRLALADAAMAPEDIGYINAHGTSTPFNDANETKAIKTVFGAHAKKLMVSSTKSMTAHMLGAAGGAEAVVSTLALARGVIPPTANYTTPDPECDLDYVPNTAREVRVNAVLSNSFGFGGTNAVLIFKRFK
jgi:3-oxoacyl-[acyl-carrier-protein] synthase II